MIFATPLLKYDHFYMDVCLCNACTHPCVYVLATHRRIYAWGRMSVEPASSRGGALAPRDQMVPLTSYHITVEVLQK